jgi:hypothetical protein
MGVGEQPRRYGTRGIKARPKAIKILSHVEEDDRELVQKIAGPWKGKPRSSKDLRDDGEIRQTARELFLDS